MIVFIFFSSVLAPYFTTRASDRIILNYTICMHGLQNKGVWQIFQTNATNLRHLWKKNKHNDHDILLLLLIFLPVLTSAFSM